MPDIMTRKQRSERMSRVRNKDTKPEKVVRSLLHRLGYRFRLHEKNLPGKPDIVLPRHAKVIFVHGCFWHRHGACRELSIPENNADFWEKKFEQNVHRDQEKIVALGEAGWSVLVVWECETRNPATLEQVLLDFLKEGAQLPESGPGCHRTMKGKRSGADRGQCLPSKLPKETPNVDFISETAALG